MKYTATGKVAATVAAIKAEEMATKKKSSSKMQIDENLRRAYQDVLDDEIPERFRDLLAQLRAQDHNREAERDRNGDRK